MAFVVTNRNTANSASGHGTGSFTTGAFTPTANSLLVCIAEASEDSGTTNPAADITISDSEGLTWTPQVLAGSAVSWSLGHRVFTAPVGASPASMTITVDCGARNISRWHVRTFDITGHNVASPVVQVQSDNSIATNGADSMAVFGSSVTSGNLVISILGRDIAPGATSVVTHGTGWTELFDGQHTSLAQSLQAQYRTDLSDTTAGAWDDVEASGATCSRAWATSLEIAAAATTLTASVEDSIAFDEDFTIGWIVDDGAEGVAFDDSIDADIIVGGGSTTNPLTEISDITNVTYLT